MDRQQSEQDTREHIAQVRAAIGRVIELLQVRATHHDESKLQEPELSGFAALHGRLADIRFGSPEYRAALEEAAPTIAHHYAHNSHHPQHYPDGIAGMSLLDLVEMFCDWYAAGLRTKDGSLAVSLAINVDRFNIAPQLAAILENTRRELGWE